MKTLESGLSGPQDPALRPVHMASVKNPDLWSGFFTLGDFTTFFRCFLAFHIMGCGQGRDGLVVAAHRAVEQRPRRAGIDGLEDAEAAREGGGAADALAGAGVAPGDRVAGFLPNIPETVIAMLATASLGAVWSSCSPDFGLQGVLDRFGQIEPRVLIAADGYTYGGKEHSVLPTVQRLMAELPTVETTVVVPYLDAAVEGGDGRPVVRVVPDRFEFTVPPDDSLVEQSMIVFEVNGLQGLGEIHYRRP